MKNGSPDSYFDSSRYETEMGLQKRRSQGFNAFATAEADVHRRPTITTGVHRLQPSDSYRHTQNASQQMLLRPYRDYANKPFTKQVDQLLYELPQQNKFSINSLCQPPEFLKVFSDVRCVVGEKAVFDCVLLGSPRPRVCWLFNDEKRMFDDVFLEDTSDICRCTIKRVRPYHYGNLFVDPLIKELYS
uniref:Ig-like domain-containing protein n=1 Tax=Globodera pallida TaxID=36090 RepID=A0A183C342_GLOPA